VIRSATVSDAASLTELWRAAGLRHSELTERELASSLRPDLVLVEADAAGEITGTVFGTFDGVRGWVRRLATRPDRRGRGIATALLAELERRLIADGCPKVNLLIEPDNAAVAGFYARLGYRRDDLLFMEKWLAPDDPPQASEPVRESWRDIRPDLAAEQYVFASADALDPPPGLAPFAVIREDEGLTLILTRSEADLAGLAYGYVAARITLRVNSALADVGLTATFSRILADAGISCNVIAGLAHDHLFVEWDQGARALALLRDRLRAGCR
jgi:ribosomal protein S18 acetylase RimI-like enzyme